MFNPDTEPFVRRHTFPTLVRDSGKLVQRGADRGARSQRS
jgi:hypothetical protein